MVADLSIGIGLPRRSMPKGLAGESPSSPGLFLSHSCAVGLDWVVRSTATKLARTLDRGRGFPEGSKEGDRPRDGGEVVLALFVLAALFSNLANRLRTLLGPDMPAGGFTAEI
jgi:hypothetical protein